MNEQMFFATAVAVFILMMVGLGLTIFEFRRGEPRRQRVIAKSRTRRDMRYHNKLTPATIHPGRHVRSKH